jgi:hypothetical protein
MIKSLKNRKNYKLKWIKIHGWILEKNILQKLFKKPGISGMIWY